MGSTITAKCMHVEDGDTFRTDTDVWIRLARVHAPDRGELGFGAVKIILTNKIGHTYISYEQVGASYNRIVAEVWKNVENINNYMIEMGYRE